MVELIAFLIEHFHDFDTCPPSNDLGNLLEEAGFNEAEIHNALMLLDVLTEEPQWQVTGQSKTALRVYWAEEAEAIPADVRGFLYSLEQANALNAGQREFVINALLFMPPEDISINMAKVMSLLVLWAQKAELPVLIGEDLMTALHGEATMH